jgi:hypothetical protein
VFTALTSIHDHKDITPILWLILTKKYAALGTCLSGIYKTTSADLVGRQYNTRPPSGYTLLCAVGPGSPPFSVSHDTLYTRSWGD